MFEKQIDLLEKFISDWDAVSQQKPQYDWFLDLGLCTNCQIGIRSLMDTSGLPYQQSKEFLEDMWSGFPGYSGDLYHPICDKESYVKMTNFTEHPERLELAKYALQYLKAKNESTN